MKTLYQIMRKNNLSEYRADGTPVNVLLHECVSSHTCFREAIDALKNYPKEGYYLLEIDLGVE